MRQMRRTIMITPIFLRCALALGLTSTAFGQSGASIAVVYYAPAWGPNTNGEEVVYFLKQVTLRSQDYEQSRIYFCSVKPDGSERREITQLWKDNPDQYLGDYAKYITMDVNAATKRAAIGIEAGGHGGVFVLNLDGTKLQPVWPKEWKQDCPTKAGYPTWSPDGEWLAFHEHRDEKGLYGYRIVKCRPDGTGYMPLTDRQEYNYQPAWSPRGDLIAYVKHRDFHLWLMKADGTGKRDTTHWGQCPRWSPDGKLILHAGIILVDAGSGQRVTASQRFPEMFPKWGGNGFLEVIPEGINYTPPSGEGTQKLLKNVSRRGQGGDGEKEEFRW